MKRPSARRADATTRRTWGAGLAALALTACAVSIALAQGSPRPAGPQAASAKPPAARCLPGPGASGAPRNIEEMVALINTLPRPVSIACFVESLDRPLKIFATNSRASLQLATSPSDPRVFIFNGPLIMSVAADGRGASLLEASVLQPGNKQSLKSELRFPITEAVPPALPYGRILEGEGTACGFFCHGSEVRDARITFAEAFVSRAIRPAASSEIQLDTLHRLNAECRQPPARRRCELLQALLGHGEVHRQDFPAEMSEGF